MELDGSHLVFETSSLRDGFYDENFEEVDSEIAKVYKHLLNQTYQETGFTVEYIIKAAISWANENDLWEICDPPNITKAVADGLAKNNELMTFAVLDAQLMFVCFGTRPIVVSTIESMGGDAINVSPLFYYYAADKSNKYGFYQHNIFFICNESKNMGGIIMDVDIIKHTAYKRLAEEETQ